MLAGRLRRSPFVVSLIVASSLAVVGFGAYSVAGSREISAASGLQTSLSRAVAEYEELDRRVRTLDARIARTNHKVSAFAKDMIEIDKETRKAAVELYKSGSTIAVEKLIELDIAELPEIVTYLQSSAQFHVTAFERFAVQQARLDATLDRLDIAREQAEQARSEMAEIQAEIREQLAAARAEWAVSQEASQVASATPPAPAVPGPPYNADWDAIAMCESGGNWHIDSTYDGGLQFHPYTWLSYGGGQYARYAWQASREEQIAIAEKVLAAQGPDAWPNCYQE